jgi:hypothetical protein
MYASSSVPNSTRTRQQLWIIKLLKTGWLLVRIGFKNRSVFGKNLITEEKFSTLVPSLFLSKEAHSSEQKK